MVIGSLVIKSLFVGVIVMGMFSAQEAANEERSESLLQDSTGLINDPKSSLRVALDEAMLDTDRIDMTTKSWQAVVAAHCRDITEHTVFHVVIFASITAVAVMAGLEFDGNTGMSESEYAIYEWVFLCVFTVEIILKVLTFESKPLRFILSPSGSSWTLNGWNLMVCACVGVDVDVGVCVCFV